MESGTNWHALLAPIPDSAVAIRKPVASSEILATPEGSAIAGWEQVTVELSLGGAGLRHFMIVLDATGAPISAGDTVVYRSDDGEADRSERDVAFRIESIGGRLEADGSFRGTRWVSWGIEHAGEIEPAMESKPSEPTEGEISALLLLIEDVMRRPSHRQGEA